MNNYNTFKRLPVDFISCRSKAVCLSLETLCNLIISVDCDRHVKCL